MITVTIEGIDSFDLRNQAKQLFGLVEIEEVGCVTSDVPENAEANPNVAPAPEPKKTRGRKPKAEAAPDEAPEVLTVEQVKTETAAEAAPAKDDGLTLEDVRKVVNEALTKGGLDDKIREIVRSFKTGSGTPVAKVSQLLKADYAAVIAKVKALL